MPMTLRPLPWCSTVCQAGTRRQSLPPGSGRRPRSSRRRGSDLRPSRSQTRRSSTLPCVVSNNCGDDDDWERERWRGEDARARGERNGADSGVRRCLASARRKCGSGRELDRGEARRRTKLPCERRCVQPGDGSAGRRRVAHRRSARTGDRRFGCARTARFSRDSRNTEAVSSGRLATPSQSADAASGQSAGAAGV
jgi:hypothetical protein